MKLSQKSWDSDSTCTCGAHLNVRQCALCGFAIQFGHSASGCLLMVHRLCCLLATWIAGIKWQMQITQCPLCELHAACAHEIASKHHIWTMFSLHQPALQLLQDARPLDMLCTSSNPTIIRMHDAGYLWYISLWGSCWCSLESRKQWGVCLASASMSSLMHMWCTVESTAICFV